MSYLQWSDALSVEVRELDEQRKKLVGMIDELHAGLMVKQGRPAVSAILRKMIEYAATHFATEERQMVSLDLPGCEVHKAEHNSFIAKVVEFQQKFLQDSVSLSLEVMEFLENWLTGHIMVRGKLYNPPFHMKGLM